MNKAVSNRTCMSFDIDVQPIKKLNFKDFVYWSEWYRKPALGAQFHLPPSRTVAT